MKIGINLLLWTTHVSDKEFPLFPLLKETGYTGLEIPLSDYSKYELSNIRQNLADNGLACTSSTIVGEAENPISENKQIRQQAVDKLKKDIDLSHAIGSEILIGPMHSAHKLFVGRGPSLQEQDYCREVFREVADYAAQAQIKIGLEFLNRFECYFLTHSKEAVALCDSIEKTNVGVLYDTHHANIEENNVYDAIVAGKRSINHFHVSESHRGTPGTGQVNWDDTFRALRDINYQNWIVIEAFGDKVADIVGAVNIWRNCFKSEEEVYQKGYDWVKNHLL